jgi:hypothetical protein
MFGGKDTSKRDWHLFERQKTSQYLFLQHDKERRLLLHPNGKKIRLSKGTNMHSTAEATSLS